MNRRRVTAAVFLTGVVLIADAPRAGAQARDGLLNGTVIGAAIGAGAGVAFTHAVRDSDLVFSQYLRGALIGGALGAGLGVGVDALFYRRPGAPAPTAPRRFRILPAVGRDIRAGALVWSW